MDENSWGVKEKRVRCFSCSFLLKSYCDSGRLSFITLLVVLSCSVSLSTCSLLSISSQFLSLSLNRILCEKGSRTKVYLHSEKCDVARCICSSWPSTFCRAAFTPTWFFLLFCPQSVWSWWTAERRSAAADCPTRPETTQTDPVSSTHPYWSPHCRSVGPTSSLFHVRLLRARGSRLSGARGRSSTGLPLTSGALLVEMTGGIFLNLRLSSKTRSTNW